MSAEHPAASGGPDGTGAAEAARRHRAALLLGDLLPESTADDVDGHDEAEASRRSRDEELRRDVPPHHGG